MNESPKPVRVPRESLETFTSAILRHAGLSSQHAGIVANILVEGDARGLPSHGVVRLLPVYVDRLLKGSMNPEPDITVLTEEEATAHIDGDGGPGQVTARHAMDRAVSLARTSGVGVALARNSSHFGVGSVYVEQATRCGCVGIAFTNAPANMPPAGGKNKFFGTNPITIGVPFAGEFPLILDMSTSVVARGRIAIAQREGKPIPEGWAIDAEGNPTTDPERALAGSVLPMAGYKGSGLALMIDILAGVLSGSAYGTHIVDLYDKGPDHQNLGHFMLALNIERFMPLNMFASRMEQFVADVRSQPRMPGVERIFLPGEIEYEATQESNRLGIEISVNGLDEINAVALSVGVEPLCP